MSAYNNNITVFGIVGRDAEIKEIPERGHVANFPLAVYRTGRGDSKKTDWFYVEAWHDLARGAFACCKKGKKYLVHGAMKFEQSEKDGIRKNFASLVARYIGEDISIPAGEDTEEDPFE